MRKRHKKPNIWQRFQQRRKLAENITSTKESKEVPKVDKKKKIKLRKNFLPTFIAIVILWTGLAMLIYFVDPYSSGAIILFFLMVFLTLLFTFSMLFANSRRGFIMTVAVVFFLFLKYVDVGNILNLLLLLGLATTAEFYFTNR